jgi:23S rRNA (guanine745-N1)-methyltransferase
MKPRVAQGSPVVALATDQKLALVCPVCEQPLSWGEQACACAQGHSFDLAREGYVNLLLSHCRRSDHPGDSVDMVQARRRFLDSGAFTRLSELLQSEVRQRLARGETAGYNVVDAGCGEGYFLGALQEAVTGACYGVDVSKEAIRLAARRYRSSRWVVANVMRRMPFASNSLDVVLSVLAPRNVEEFSRVLKPAGLLVVVVPGPDHLLELRTRLMAEAGDFQAKADAAIDFCAPRFALQQKKSLTYEVVLNKNLLTDLVQMTPLFWRSTRQAKTGIGGLEELRVTMSFALLVFTRMPVQGDSVGAAKRIV